MIFLQITLKTTIMKTKKFFMLLAAVLLSVSAFAQSDNNEPLKGDVNGDGVVDYADIDAVIEIMKNAGGYTADYNNGGGWTSTGNSVPDNINQLVKGFDRTKELFVAVPITSGTTLTPVASDMSTTDTSVIKVSTKTLNSVNYQIYTYGTGLPRNTIMFAKK